ncbi:MAG: hypothetical protein BRD50_00865 [Bacteroidetes bacterium SW_11_45_7]|nr:MAG: hypothetical protein BRD50_00865 [Bacteroidetes bacterium SW_11_45_7]
MIIETILEVLKITIPSLIVLLTAYLVIRSFMKNESQKQEHQLRMETRKESLPIRLQAYERLALFMERISPYNMINRVRDPNMTAKDLQLALIKTIRTEYEHNLSQQIYVSAQTWNTVRLSKDEMIKLINLISASLPPDRSGKELSKAIFDYLMQMEETLPTQKALDVINAEAKKVL